MPPALLERQASEAGDFFAAPPTPGSALAQRLARIRALTYQLCAPLSAEDACAQSMPEASPAKWHFAHSTWFFETFVLQPHARGYELFDESYGPLFNSSYHAIGKPFAREHRGLLTRPTLAEVIEYRIHVDAALGELLGADPAPALAAMIELAIQHEQQHQELLLTDIKHLFAQSPLRPAYQRLPLALAAPASLRWVGHEGGIVEVGHVGAGFGFDHEKPRHQALLQPFELASRPVSNAEFRQFIADGGYRRPALWLADGWNTVLRCARDRPLYWSLDLGREFTLNGEQLLDPHRPVCHLSYYEADAYARWAGARLPTEFEWEAVASRRPASGQFLESRELHPRVLAAEGAPDIFGSVWAWTSSAYAPYPGYRPAPGPLGQHDGKFMCGRMVLRGGSCATPRSHLRASYRNHLHADARWQFSGVRLARSL